jgi:Na+-transporting NADH:ubiquinone oxidoreductase subunit NqrB
MKRFFNPRNFISAFLIFIFMFAISGETYAATFYKHSCKKCSVSVTDTRKSGPKKVRCPKGGYHNWRNSPIKK